MVQGRIEPSVVLNRTETDAPGQYEAVPDSQVIAETIAVADIRLTRPDAQRTLIVGEEGFDQSDLEPTRLVAWNISKAVLDNRAGDQGADTALYLLRDQKQYSPDTYADVYQAEVEGVPMFIRSEEGLLYRAHQLIEQVLTSTKNPDSIVSACDIEGHGDCVVRANDNGSSSHLPLRGYEFNPRDTGSERVQFDHYPSCEVFLAASALEQAELADGDGVIRICHYGLRNRDTAAKTLLQAAGYTDLPIETVALGDDGKPNKIFSWHTNDTVKASLRRIIREAVILQGE